MNKKALVMEARVEARVIVLAIISLFVFASVTLLSFLITMMIQGKTTTDSMSHPNVCLGLSLIVAVLITYQHISNGVDVIIKQEELKELKELKND